MTVSTWPSSSSRREPCPAIRADQVVGAARGRARHALDLGLRRQERRAQRDRLLGALDVARGRGDRDERLELARGAGGDLGGAVSDELIHPRSLPRPRERQHLAGAAPFGALAVSRHVPRRQLAQGVVDRRGHPVQAAEQRDLAVQVVGLDRAACRGRGSAGSRSRRARGRRSAAGRAASSAPRRR